MGAGQTERECDMASLFPDPFEGLFNFQRALESAFRSDWLGGGLSGRGAYPPINIFRQGDDYVAIIELPGVERKDLDIQVRDNRIRITGNKTVSYESGASLHRRERIGGSFDRTIAVPIEVDADRVRAEYRDGILALHLPWAERAKPRSVTIS